MQRNVRYPVLFIIAAFLLAGCTTVHIRVVQPEMELSEMPPAPAPSPRPKPSRETVKAPIAPFPSNKGITETPITPPKSQAQPETAAAAPTAKAPVAAAKPPAAIEPPATKAHAASPIPQFPWPPPEASARSRVPKRWFLPSGAGTVSLRYVDFRLTRALREAGYGSKAYYAVPEGFALVTRLEQITPDGAPKPANERWAVNAGSHRVFSLTDYVKALSGAKPGYFRVVVFVVTSYPFSFSKAKVTPREVQLWLPGDLKRLPTSIGDRRFTNNHYCEALIYEFEKGGAEKTPHQVAPGRLGGREHLTQSGLWTSLEQ